MADPAQPTDAGATDAGATGTDDPLATARAVLATCRDRVEAFETGQARSNRALYEALEVALRLDRQLDADPRARRTLLKENGLKAARKGANPFTTVVKLAFGEADRARVNKYAT
ncbi:MAG: hypothetical protein GVY28_00715, partial [Alphaproteobacteria bacterium]|nr:hypothetical protein [Alphaproteobacteria bacterium]